MLICLSFTYFWLSDPLIETIGQLFFDANTPSIAGRRRLDWPGVCCNKRILPAVHIGARINGVSFSGAAALPTQASPALSFALFDIFFVMINIILYKNAQNFCQF